jgi:hypothetical protein
VGADISFFHFKIANRPFPTVTGEDVCIVSHTAVAVCKDRIIFGLEMFAPVNSFLAFPKGTPPIYVSNPAVATPNRQFSDKLVVIRLKPSTLHSEG